MFGRVTITLGIGPHSSCVYFVLFLCYRILCLVFWGVIVILCCQYQCTAVDCLEDHPRNDVMCRVGR